MAKIKFCCKILVVREDGIYFSGEDKLVRDPEEAKKFDDMEEVLDMTRDLLWLSTADVTQIRIIGCK